MKELNEYKVRARELTKELLTVSVTQCKTKEFERGGRKDVVKIFDICRINHVTYIKASDVYFSFNNKKSMLMDKGVLQESDFAFFVINKGHPITFLRADVVYKKREELTRLCTDKYQMEKSIIPVAEAAIEAKIKNVDVDYLRFQRSQDACRERAKLLHKSREHTIKKQEEMREIARQKREDEKKNEEKTLRELVEQIEMMGWHVTLSMK